MGKFEIDLDLDFTTIESPYYSRDADAFAVKAEPVRVDAAAGVGAGALPFALPVPTAIALPVATPVAPPAAAELQPPSPAKDAAAAAAAAKPTTPSPSSAAAVPPTLAPPSPEKPVAVGHGRAGVADPRRPQRVSGGTSVASARAASGRPSLPGQGPPPHPRLVFSYYRPTMTWQGPAQLVMLPPGGVGAVEAKTPAGKDAAGTDDGASPITKAPRHKDQWMANFLKAPRTVMAQNRRSYSRPEVGDVLGALRHRQKQQKGAGPRTAVVKEPAGGLCVVPSSLGVVYMNTHRLLLALVDAAFTLKDALSDFLLLSVLRAEIAHGVYTTPPQLVLQLHRRFIGSQCLLGQDLMMAEAVVARLDALWRHWRTRWTFPRHMQRIEGCHDHMEAMVDRNELGILRTQMVADSTGRGLLRDRFVCGAGALLCAEEYNEPPEMLTILGAVTRVLMSPEAYPAFTVHAPFDLLRLDRKYRVSFRQLRGGVKIEPHASSTIFVRNWAVPFVDMPGDGRFRVPNIAADAESAPSASAPSHRHSPRTSAAAAPARPATQPQIRVRWAAPMVVMKADTRYYNRVHVAGTDYALGQDVLVDYPVTTKGKDVLRGVRDLAKKTLGRIVQMSDEGDGEPKRIVVRKWDKKSPSGCEVSATDTVVNVPPDVIVCAVEVRVVAPEACQLPEIPRAVGLAAPTVYSPADLAACVALPSISEADRKGYEGAKFPRGKIPVIKLTVEHLVRGKEPPMRLYEPPPPPPPPKPAPGGLKLTFGRAKAAPPAPVVAEPPPPPPPSPPAPTPPSAPAPAPSLKRTADDADDDVQIIDPPPGPPRKRLILRRTPTPTPMVKLEPVKAEAPVAPAAVPQGTGGGAVAGGAAPPAAGALGGLNFAALLNSAPAPVAVVAPPAPAEATPVPADAPPAPARPKLTMRRR